MGAHGSRAAFRTPGVALVRVWIGVVFHLVIPSLDMEGRRTISARERGGGGLVTEANRVPVT